MTTLAATYGRLSDRLRVLGDVVVGVAIWLVAPFFVASVVISELIGPVFIIVPGLILLTAGVGVVTRYGDTLQDRADTLVLTGMWVNIAVIGTWALVTETDAFAVGVVTGSVLALGAIGLTLIYGILKFAHFAHGDSMMLAAYVAFFVLTGTAIGERTDAQVLPWSLNDLPGATSRIPWPGEGEFSFGYGLLIALVITAAVMALVFVALDRLIYRHLRRRGSSIVIFAIASLGVAITMRSLLLVFWSGTSRLYVLGTRPTTDLPLDVRIVTDQIFIFFIALAMAALVYLLLFRTKLGKAMRAMSDNADLARVSGINTQQVINWTWIIGGVLVAVAGVMLALQAQLKPELGFVLLLPVFAATILGGIGSPQGAFVGGMIVGVAQEVAVTFDFISPGYKFSVAFVILILILLMRPRGLFGDKG